MMTNQNQHTLLSVSTSNLYKEDESRIWKKIQEGPALPLATVGFLGIAGYRIYKARSRGSIKMSMFLIHTRLAAQGFGVAVLGSLVLYSLGERFYNSFNNEKTDAVNER